MRRGTTATTPASATAKATTTGCRNPRSGMPRAWYCPQPQIENGESRPDWNPSVRSQNVRIASQSDGSSRRIEKASTVAAANAAREARDPAELGNGIRRPERRDEQRAELRPAGERDRRPARPVRRDEQESEQEERGHDRVVRVGVQRVRRERVAPPRRRRAARRAAGLRTAGRPGRARARRAGRTRSRSRAPRAASPTSRSTGRQRRPGRTRGTTPGPYVSPRSIAASQRPFVWMRSRTCPSESFGPHGSRSPRCGMFPYGASPSRIRLAPTTPASPTSITPRGVSRLSPTRKPSRKTAAAASTQVGQTERERRTASTEPDPQPAREQVDEHRVDERDAPEDLAAVEERERDGEAEQREEVEVSHRERPAQIGEPEEEDQAEAEPDVRPQERLAAERALASASHLPCDLWPGPRLRDAPGRVLDDGLRDLPGLARPHLDEPRARLGRKSASVVGSGG